MNIKKQLSSLLIILVCVLPLTQFGCKEDLQMGQERIVESNLKNPPKWVKTPPKKTWQYLYFVGEDTSYKNTDRYAYQVALSKAGSYFNTRAKTTFSRIEDSDNEYEANVLREEYIKNVSESSIKGAIHKDTYWEKIEKLTENGYKYFYRVYVLIALDRKAVRATEEATLDIQAQNTQNETTRQLLNDIKNDIIKDYELEGNNDNGK